MPRLIIYPNRSGAATTSLLAKLVKDLKTKKNLLFVNVYCFRYNAIIELEIFDHCSPTVNGCCGQKYYE